MNILILPAATLASEAQSQVPQIETGQSEQVLITATQRVTQVLDAPGAASVFTSDRLDDTHVTSVKQLVTLAPSMNVINSIGESFGQLIAVRGVATSGADMGLESTVAVTVDGVQLMRPNLAIFDFQGVDRVEFLRGPQGTLFGANTTGGVINVLTRRPAFMTSRFEASATLGEREERELRLSADGPLVTDKLAGRLDLVVGAVDGYLPDPNNGNVYGARHRDEVRGQLLFVPTSDSDVRVIADYLHHGGTVNSPVYRVLGATGPMIGQLGGVPLIASFDARNLAQIDDKAPRFEKSESAGVSAETNWYTEAGKLTVIAAYRSAKADRSYDVDNSPADLANDPHDGEHYGQGTLELRFQGKTDRFDYLFGAYAGRGLIVSRDSYTAGAALDAFVNGLASGHIPAFTGLPAGSNFPAGSGVLDVFRQRSTSYAVFTHHVITLADGFSLTLGARYTAESKSLSASITSDIPGCANAIALHGRALSGVPASVQSLICVPNLDPRYDGDYAADRDEGNWSGTAALNDRLSDSLSAYLSYSRGYKGGGFQLDRSGMDPSAPALSQVAFRQETADSVEGGLHLVSPDDVWRASAALFHTSFNDYQFSYFAGLNRRTTNVPELVTKGLEAEAAYRPLEGLELSFSGTYQEAVFGESGFPSGLTQLEGSTAPIAPRWVLVAAASYRHPLESLGVIGFGDIDVRWQSKSNVGASATPSPNFLQDAYAVVGARIGAEAPDRNWRVELWARNLFNQQAWSILNSTTLQPGSISGFVTGPRSMGITATLAW
ncbi:MAG TPA: TonB-dependent receptor [Micropepsaceae bacterium]|nr:TonB-dependent receptor [Micropepsaceae bacterium]